MREKPILFSGPMVRAILDGAKTQTRRLVKLRDGERVHVEGGEVYPLVTSMSGHDRRGAAIGRPFSVGDTLWVREAWRFPLDLDTFSPKDVGVRLGSRTFAAPSAKRLVAPMRYEADGAVTPSWMPWCQASGMCSGRYRHARFMPRWASRLTLRVTDVRVERLGDISEADARAEGAMHWWRTVDGNPDLSPRHVWEHLWEHVYGDGAWELDRERWVWVYGFEVVR